MAQHIAVIGAGAFGGWSALMLQRKGYKVTLIDAWGAGNSLSSSGDETRIIRSVYADKIYAEMAHRAGQIWRENERNFHTKIFHPIGVLNLIGKDDSRLKAALRHFDDLQLKYRAFSLKEAAKKYPYFNLDGINEVVLDAGGGYLLARMGCHVVKERFVKEGGTYKVAAAQPLSIKNGALAGVQLSDGTMVLADQYVFACGAWLGKLFPEAIGALVRPTRQEIFYFGVPAGSDIMAKTPVWCDFSSVWENVMMYGIPATGSDAEGRGFKIGEDVLGDTCDPNTQERQATAKCLEKVRTFMHHRFPTLQGMPLIEARVCQYENTPDAHFIIDKLPNTQNAWILGGGSGHGYKMGAVVGEMITELIEEKAKVNPLFGFDRFKQLSEHVTRR
jgi:glycine/D-amino acid oxidase-like deaminating enzyme